MQKLNGKTTRRILSIVTIACVCLSGLGGSAQDRGSESLRQRLEGEARQATIISGSLRLRLETEGYLATHPRTEEYPEPEDYDDLDLPIEEVVIPEQLPGNVTPQTIDPAAIETIVHAAANQYQVDPFLVFGIIRVESNFDPYAVSGAGARGLMQLMPGTAADMGVLDPFDPVQNVMGGTQYISLMLRYFKNDVTLALAGYNAGPGNVKKYGGVPPFEETQNYVVKVQRYRDTYAQSGVEIVMASARELVLASALPNTSGPYYRLTLRSGLTQPVEVLVDSGEYYLTQYKGHATRIRKELVSEIALQDGDAR